MAHLQELFCYVLTTRCKGQKTSIDGTDVTLSGQRLRERETKGSDSQSVSQSGVELLLLKTDDAVHSCGISG